MKSRGILLFISIGLNVALIAGIAGVTGWRQYRRVKKPFDRDYYISKVSLFNVFENKRGDIVFVGDSQTDRCEWAELLNRRDVINRGIDGDTTDGVLNRLGEITAMKPQKIFLMVGGADFIIGRTVAQIEENYRKIIGRIRSESPETKIYLQNMLPTVQRIFPMPLELIRGLNGRLALLADDRNVFYVDVHGAMVDSTGGLNPSYSIDGVHLNGRGYLAWRKVIAPLIAP